MRNTDIFVEALATERILEDTENAIAGIERILRKPLPPAELSKFLSQYKELTLEKEAFSKMSATLLPPLRSA